MRSGVLRHSIGTKIFVAFFVMSVLIGALGAYGYWVLSSAGDMVTGTYDGPLMAINYARAASVDFVQMEEAVLRRRVLPPSHHAEIDKNIGDLTTTFFGDLDVAQDRLGSEDERAVAARIRALMKNWQQQWRARDSNLDLDALDTKIMERFDTLIELNTDRGFVGRRKAVWAIGYFKYAILGGTIFALLFAFGITVLLARRIMHPLSSAASAADRIARGEFETPIPHAGNDETGILLSSMTVMQDNIRAMMAREKARAESAEARLAQALETSREGVMLVGSDGHVLLVNNTMREFFPSVANDLVTGADFALIAQLAQNDLENGAVFPTLDDLSIGHDAQELGSSERLLKDGRWIRSTGSRTHDGGFIVFMSDFTAIKEREQNFRRATLAAETASAAKSRFLANMSHELRTPLNAIIGFSEILSGQIFGPLGNARYGDYATDILHSGRHLLEVINSVLEISKSESGKQNLKAERIDLRVLLRDCEKLLAARCETAHIALAIYESEKPAVVFGETGKLRQILFNLLSNAVKFTEAGGSVSASLGHIGQQIVLEVADTGIGMSAAGVQVALTPFGQVDNRLERKYEGTGLGLPLARSLAELHGGTLEIQSALGEGTVVRVRLPDVEYTQVATPMAVAS